MRQRLTRIAQGQLGGQNVGVSDRRGHLVHSRQRLSRHDGHSVRARRPEYNHRRCHSSYSAGYVRPGVRRLLCQYCRTCYQVGFAYFLARLCPAPFAVAAQRPHAAISSNEVVGAWSMVDIFLVGILSAIVQLGALATIEPGIGASFFGAVVVVTMFAAKSFDPRLIWDHAAVRE